MWLKFYADERARWPELAAAGITDRAAERALKKLARHFKTGPVRLRFSGKTISWGGPGGIQLAKERTWLVFLHEFGHVLEYHKHGVTEHRKRLAKIVDRICRYATKQGWAQADLDDQFRDFCEHEALHAATEDISARLYDLTAKVDAALWRLMPPVAPETAAD